MCVCVCVCECECVCVCVCVFCEVLVVNLALDGAVYVSVYLRAIRELH